MHGNHSKKVEPFRSSFDGNNRNYFFNRKSLFEEKEYIPYSNAEKEEHRFKTGIGLIGHAVKDSLISFGKAVKKTTVTGYNYVKEKLTDEPVNQIVDDNCYSYSKNPKITNKTYGFDDYSKMNRNNKIIMVIRILKLLEIIIIRIIIRIIIVIIILIMEIIIIIMEITILIII